MCVFVGITTTNVLHMWERESIGKCAHEARAWMSFLLTKISVFLFDSSHAQVCISGSWWAHFSVFQTHTTLAHHSFFFSFLFNIVIHFTHILFSCVWNLVLHTFTASTFIVLWCLQCNVHMLCLYIYEMELFVWLTQRLNE